MDTLINKIEISEFLTEAGCCKICVLRFLKPRMEDFLNVDKSLKDFHSEKKFKLNTCVTCFGLMELIEDLVKEIKSDDRLKLFQVNRFITSYSLPMSLNLAQLQMWLALLEKFPDYFDDRKEPDISVKDALKHIVNMKLTSEMSKELSVEGMMISMNFVHDDEKDLFDKLAAAIPERMREWNRRKKINRTEIMSRAYFEKNFNPETIDIEKLRKFISSPPEVPNSSIRLDKIDFTGPTVFIAGRYNKFSRKLSQTPWIVDGKRLAENSVEDIMVDAVLPHFMVDTTSSVTFMSSGREDVDVRCLGKGRPFALEIVNAKRDNLEPSSFTEIETKVRQSALIAIRDLQMVHRNDLHHIKTGEEEKRKFYRALCILRNGEDVSAEVLEKLQINEPFEIQQWTPIRVLHRRSLLKRPRMIYSVKAFAVKDKPNQIILDIVTQAGTYVKELVHGEFQRTSPSIASIIGKDIDITSLDVMNIDLNFPPTTTR